MFAMLQKNFTICFGLIFENSPTKARLMKKLLIIPLLILLAACETDDNEPLLNTNRYMRVADVVSLPAINYDADGSPPDIRIDLKRRSTNFWEFSTDTEINAGTLPVLAVFPAEILATDEVYEIRIVDEDPNEPQDDEIFYWQFHAFDEGENGAYSFYDRNQLIMTLGYNEK